MPAHQVVVAASLEQQLDGALAADLQQVAVVHPVIGLQVVVGRCGAIALDAGALAQRTDRGVPHRVVKLSQLGLGLGVVEQHLGVADDRQGVVGDLCRLVVLVVDVVLDDLVAGQRDGEVRGRGCGRASYELLVTRGDDALAEPVVAVLDLGGELFARGLVARTVEVEVGPYEVLVERPALPVAARRVAPRQFVVGRHANAHLAGPDHLRVVHLLLREEAAVLGPDVGRVVHDRVDAGIHQFAGGVGCGAQEAVGGLTVLPGFAGRGVYGVVFAVGSLEQADARLVGQGDVAVDACRVDPAARVVAVRAGEVEILEHALHDVFAAVARLVEGDHVLGVDRGVVPGHCAEEFHLLEVLPGAPEAGRSLIMGVGLLGKSAGFVHVCQEVVDVVDRLPVADRPAGLQVGGPRGVGQKGERLFRGHDVGVSVTVSQGFGAGGVFLKETVRVGDQRGFVLEIVARTHLGNGFPVEEALAGGQCCAGCEQYADCLFHESCGFRRLGSGRSCRIS